jgi:uroporphyrinogen III methyltransferase/synthase
MADSSTTFRIGARSSGLALVQARRTVGELERRLPGVAFELVPFDSPGDRDRQTDLRVSPADFFTRDLDEAVRNGTIDAAVHSAKDVPDPVPEGLDWCWLPWRAEPRDALVIPAGSRLEDMPAAPRIGVSSDRRIEYCRSRFPNGEYLPIRGNIEHRLAQLDAGDFDLVIIAAAALDRLGLSDRIASYIPLDELPVPEGQGVLCLTFRAGDARWQRIRSLFVKSVTFAGAGVGTTDNVTRGVATALATCDVCFHDSLIPGQILSLVSPQAAVVDVGKRSGRHSAEQRTINELLADACRKGQRVVRLKGGDPAIFGRLGEELDTLDTLGLPSRILPAVSALNAVAPASGILLTERGVTNGFAVLTPRQAGGGTASVQQQVRARFPVVAYMSVKSCGKVCADLLADGWDGSTPAAMIFGAGCPEGFSVRATLATLPDRVAETDTTLPGLLVVGDVAGREAAQHGPLAARRVLLTCSEALQEKTAREVLDRGGIPIPFPLIQLVPTGEAAEAASRLAAFDWLVVTSPSAARVFLDSLSEAQVDVRTIPRIAVCGSQTAAEFAARGLYPDLCPDADFSAEALVTSFAKDVPAGARVLRLRSDKAGANLADALCDAGYAVEECISYRNEPVPVADLPEFADVVFASASAVEVFVDRWGPENLAGHSAVCIGKPTTAALAKHGIEPAAIGLEATMPGCIEALAAFHVNRSLLSVTERLEMGR